MMPRKMTTVVHWIQSTDDLRGIASFVGLRAIDAMGVNVDFHTELHAKAQSVNNNIRKAVRPWREAMAVLGGVAPAAADGWWVVLAAYR